MLLLLLIALIGIESAKAPCLGQKFFRTHSMHFRTGLENLCFGEDAEAVLQHLEPQKLLQTRDSMMIKPGAAPRTWFDDLSFQNWFDDAGYPFTNMFYPTWVKGTGWLGIDSFSSRDYGIQSLWLAQGNDTAMVFTFYSGPSKQFYRPIRSRHARSEIVRGLFEITIDISLFQRAYFERILDSLSYGFRCESIERRSCMEQEGGWEYPTYLRTNDPEVFLILDPRQDKFHSRLVCNMYPLSHAMQENLRWKYEAYKAKRRLVQER